MRQTIYDQVAQIQDEVALQLLAEATEAYLSPVQIDILDELSPSQLARLNESKLQIEQVKKIPHDVVIAKSKEWHTK